MFIEEKQSKTGYDAYRPPQFKRLNDKYFIKLYNNDFVVLLPKNKKLFANLYPESKSEVLAFIKEKKVKLNKEQDLLKLINFINSLW